MVQSGQDFLWPGMSDNSEYEIVEVGKGQRESDFDTSPENGEVKLNGTPPGLDEEMKPGRVIETDTLRSEIDPRDIQRRRPEAAREADAAKDAPLTTDPLQWASDPSQYDFPGVDTGPTFRESEGEDFDTESLLDFL